MSTPVQFMRMPITTPCPIPVEAGTGRTFGNDGDEPLPLDKRTELCAVDAGWMIGAARICDFHLRELFDRGFFDGGYDSLVRETFEEYGDDCVREHLEHARVPWADRKRYSQADALSWSATAARAGGA